MITKFSNFNNETYQTIFSFPRVRISVGKSWYNYYLNQIAFDMLDCDRIIIGEDMLTFKRPTIFDKSTIIKSHPHHQYYFSCSIKSNIYEDLSGVYIIEKESEDIFYLNKIEL